MGDSIDSVYTAPPVGIHDQCCGVILGKFRAETTDLFECRCPNRIVRTDAHRCKIARVPGLERSMQTTFDV